MEEEKYSDEDLSRRIAEFINVKHRCQRYWKRLIKEALAVAKEKGLEISVSEGPKSSKKGKINLFYSTDTTELHDDNLLELAKDNLGSLPRRFNKDYARYQRLEVEMKEIAEYFGV